MIITFLIPPPLDGNLPAERIFGCNYGIYSQPNIFILNAVSIAKSLGWDAEFLDCAIDNLNKDQLISRIKENDSDIYVFYTVFLSKETDIMAKKLIQAIKPDAKFIYMSTEPTNDPKPFLDDSSMVIRGEIEETLKELLKAIKENKSPSGIAGVTYMEEGKEIENPPREIIADLDELPFPDRSLISRDKYNNPKLALTPFTTVLSSRGCPHKCYYCVPNSLSFAREIEFKRNHPDGNKPPVRFRSAENVIEEITQLKKDGYRSFSFIDDEFTLNSKRAIDISKGISKLGMEWSCLARADHLINEDLIAAMAEGGCQYVDIGIESFKQEILDYIGKELKVEDVFTAVDLLKKHHIEPELNILIGSCPLETKETIEYTIKQAHKLDVDYVLFSICTPFPNTGFNKIAREKGWMIEDEYRAIDPIKESFISYPHLSKEDLEQIIRKAYIGFYFRPGYIVKRLLKLKSFDDFLNKVKAAVTILR